MRTGTIERNTKETQIKISVSLDGKGKADIDTGVGFFDHMLTALSVHSGISMDIKVRGDLHVDCHHTIEDTGIALGQALGQALGKVGHSPLRNSIYPHGRVSCHGKP